MAGRDDAVASRDRFGGMIRAILALGYAVLGSAFVLLKRDAIFDVLIHAAGVTDRSDATLDTWFRLAIYGSVLVLALVGFALFRVRPRGGAGGVKLPLVALLSGMGAVVALVAVALAAGVAAPAGALLPGIRPWLFVTGTGLVILQVCAEELMFRGLAVPLLIRAWGWLPGVIAGALGFAAVHFAGGWRDPASLANIALAGVWFGLLAWRTGGLLAPAMAHFGYNWAEEMLFGATPNPGQGMFGSIFDMDLSGAAIWGGSVEGFNSSVVLSLVLALLIAPLVRRGVVAPT